MFSIRFALSFGGTFVHKRAGTAKTKKKKKKKKKVASGRLFHVGAQDVACNRSQSGSRFRDKVRSYITISNSTTTPPQDQSKHDGTQAQLHGCAIARTGQYSTAQHRTAQHRSTISQRKKEREERENHLILGSFSVQVQSEWDGIPFQVLTSKWLSLLC